jgi:hypothetical protein
MSQTGYALAAAVWVERRIGIANLAMIRFGYSAAKRRSAFIDLSDAELERLVTLGTLAGIR